MLALRLEVEGIWLCWLFRGVARSCFCGFGSLIDSSRLIMVVSWCLGGGVIVVVGGRG